MAIAYTQHRAVARDRTAKLDLRDQLADLAEAPEPVLTLFESLTDDDWLGWAEDEWTCWWDYQASR